MQRVPEVQTEHTVRAFSGVFRRISGGELASNEVEVVALFVGAAAEKASAMRVDDSSRHVRKDVRIVVFIVQNTKPKYQCKSRDTTSTLSWTVPLCCGLRSLFSLLKLNILAGRTRCFLWERGKMPFFHYSFQKIMFK